MTTRTHLGLAEPHPQMAALISSYQDGLTGPEESDRVARHLLECERCRDFYGGLQQVRDLVAGLPDQASDPVRVAATAEAVLRRTIYRRFGRGKRSP